VSIGDGRRVARAPAFFAVHDVAANGRHTLVLSGELDIAQAVKVKNALQRLGPRGSSAITLDLSGLTFMGSTGLRIVLLAKELCELWGYEFRIVPGPAHVQRVFEFAGVIDRLPFQLAP
jgi:anti-sigma B factor antagonist